MADHFRTPAAGVRADALTLSLGGSKILRGIDLRIPPGGTVSVIGPSGSGKTSLLRCLSGLQSPTSGKVTLFDEQERTWDKEKVPMGFVFQDLGMFENSSVRQNICLGAHRLLADPSAVELIGFLALEELLDRSVTSLSGGERQRVAIARALVRKPMILFLDEVFANLDQELSVSLELMLLELQERSGFTVVYVTHDLASAGRMGERLAYLADGLIRQEGSLRELYETPATEDILRFVLPLPPFRLDPTLLKIRGLPDALGEILIRPEDALVSGQHPLVEDDSIHFRVVLRRRLAGLTQDFLLVSLSDPEGVDQFVVAAPDSGENFGKGDELWVSIPAHLLEQP